MGSLFFNLQTFMQKIPKADLKVFLSGDPNQKKAFVNRVGTAFENIGFLALKGHFLDAKLQNDLYNEIKAFFNLEEKVKNKYEIKGGGGQRGYTGFGKEHAEGRLSLIHI